MHRSKTDASRRATDLDNACFRAIDDTRWEAVLASDAKEAKS
jgi:hypothetical protein